MIIEKFLKLLNSYEEEVLKKIKSELIGAKVPFSKNVKKSFVMDKYSEYQQTFMEINTIKQYFSTFKEEDHKMFSDFTKLSEILMDLGLTNREKAQIMLEALKKNTYSGILGVGDLNNAFVLDANKILFVDFKTIPKKQIEEMYMTGSLIEFINKDLDEATIQEIEQINELIDRKEEYILNIENLYNVTVKVQKLLIDKDAILSDEEIEELLDILKDFKVNSDLINYVKLYLIHRREKHIEKVKKEEKEKVESKPFIVIEKKKSNLVTDKEYKEIKKEIYKYYNLYTQEIVNEIDLDTMIRLASLMYRIDVHRDEIYTFIKQVKDNILLTGNPISIFVLEYDRLKYYYDEEELSDIASYLKEIFICDNDDYIFWLEEIEKELNKLLKPIEYKYNYELDKAKKRLVI